VPDTLRRVGGFLEVAVPLAFANRKAGLTLSGFLSGISHNGQDQQIGSFSIGGWIQT